MGCVKLYHESANKRPTLHRKTGTISITSYRRRKMVWRRRKNNRKLPNLTKMKHVHWASPLVTTFIVQPFVEEDDEEHKLPIASKDPQPAIKIAANPKGMQFYCFDCAQSYSSRKSLNRHKKRIKHLNKLTVKQEDQQSAIGSIEIEAHPTNVPFYCFDCAQSYSSRKKLNRHNKTIKHCEKASIIKPLKQE